MKVELSSQAWAEFDDALDYYQTHASLLIVDRYIADFDHAVRLVMGYPEIGTPTSKRTRALKLRRFPYKWIYRIAAETITVVAIAHQRRRPGYWAGGADRLTSSAGSR